MKSIVSPLVSSPYPLLHSFIFSHFSLLYLRSIALLYLLSSLSFIFASLHLYLSVIFSHLSHFSLFYLRFAPSPSLLSVITLTGFKPSVSEKRKASIAKQPSSKDLIAGLTKRGGGSTKEK